MTRKTRKQLREQTEIFENLVLQIYSEEELARIKNEYGQYWLYSGIPCVLVRTNDPSDFYSGYKSGRFAKIYTLGGAVKIFNELYSVYLKAINSVPNISTKEYFEKNKEGYWFKRFKTYEDYVNHKTETNSDLVNKTIEKGFYRIKILNLSRI